MATYMRSLDPHPHVSDPARLAALDAQRILDTTAEEGFDDVVRLATRLCSAPVALVSFVAADRQWFKARIGFPDCETDLDRSVCQFALAEPDLLVVPDLAADPRTAANPLVTNEPSIRFYAGAPLRMPGGEVLGSLCVIDTAPRPGGLTPEQADDLRALGRQVVTLLIARRALGDERVSANNQREAQASQLAHAALSEAQNVALRASDERGRLAQEAGGVGLFELNVASGMMQVSAEFCRLYGVPVSPLYSAATFEALVLPEDASVRSTDETRENGSAPLDVEYRIRRADDGALRWIARRASFNRDATGTVVGMFGTVRDVTERRAIQDALKASEGSARENAQRVQLALAAGAIIGTWNWDIPADRFTVDEAFAHAFGLDPALGHEGIPLGEIVATVHPDDQAGLNDAIGEAMARGGVYAHQYRVRRTDGRYYWIEANGRVDKAEDGTPTSFPGVLLDIEERRAAQEALRASEAHWRGLFARLSEGFIVGEVIRDATGRIADWRYLDVNAAWGELVGVDPAGVPGRTIREVFPGIEDAWVNECANVVETGEAVSFERQVGSLRRWYQGSAFPLGPERFGVIFLEVTARVQADARRDALLELGDRLRDLGEVPAMVQAAAEILARMTGAARAGYGLVDAAREVVEVFPDWCAPGVVSIAGKHSFRDYGSFIDDLKRGEVVAVSKVTRDPRTRDGADALLGLGIRALLNVPVIERARLMGIGFVNYAQTHAFTADDLAFVRVVADRVQVAVARVRAEEQQQVLNYELSHRLKNTLAVVQSIASQTLRTIPEREPVEAFQRRIVALSRAHDILLQDVWAPASIRAVAANVLATHATADRLDLSGPEIGLSPAAVLSLSLLLHELATNAGKYGALSVEGGRASLTWAITTGDAPMIEVRWCERGGPPARKPRHRGFGSRLIGMGLVGTREVELAYDEEGFSAVFSAPLAQVQAS